MTKLAQSGLYPDAVGLGLLERLVFAIGTCRIGHADSQIALAVGADR